MKKDNLRISICGLTCSSCPLLNLPYDENSGNKVLEWFQSKGWYSEDQTVSDILKNGDYCKGCCSDRNDIHWSPDCTLLVCCIDKKQLQICSECGDFPCEDYREWIGKGDNHKRAYRNLSLIKKGKKPVLVKF